MDRSAGLLLRSVRGVLLAAVAVLIGGVAHVSAGGLMPGPVALSCVLLACTAGTAWLLGRPATALRVVVLLVAGQSLVHGVLTVLAGHRGPHRPAGESAAVHLSVPEAVQHLVAEVTGPHAFMALGHLAAAAVVGLWLALGERALWTVLALADDRVGEVVRSATGRLVAAAAVLVLEGRVVARAFARWAGLVSAYLDTEPASDPDIGPSVARRGPPTLLAA